jgi:uncharacterized protein YecT (DUF1311 family)
MITIERKKLEQVLKVLESDYTFEWPAMHRPERAEKKRFEAITALREALAQPDRCFRELSAAQRTWVGLTDEEFEDIELGCRGTPFGKIEAMQKVEAKLKERNT